jgi:hypothetical protein
MPYILSAQRDQDVNAAFRRYREYLAAPERPLPRGAYSLAASDWYFDPRDHRCLHDAWLESVTISEPAAGERDQDRGTTISVRLLGAHQNGTIELFYPHVFSYSLASPSCTRGLGDWRYDEFRVSANGRLIHEIEWAGYPYDKGSHWIIEASDVEFHWWPK